MRKVIMIANDKRAVIMVDGDNLNSERKREEEVKAERSESEVVASSDSNHWHSVERKPSPGVRSTQIL